MSDLYMLVRIYRSGHRHDNPFTAAIALVQRSSHSASSSPPLGSSPSGGGVWPPAAFWRVRSDLQPARYRSQNACMYPANLKASS